MYTCISVHVRVQRSCNNCVQAREGGGNLGTRLHMHASAYMFRGVCEWLSSLQSSQGL